MAIGERFEQSYNKTPHARHAGPPEFGDFGFGIRIRQRDLADFVLVMQRDGTRQCITIYSALSQTLFQGEGGSIQQSPQFAQPAKSPPPNENAAYDRSPGLIPNGTRNDK